MIVYPCDRKTSDYPAGSDSRLARRMPENKRARINRLAQRLGEALDDVERAKKPFAIN